MLLHVQRDGKQSSYYPFLQWATRRKNSVWYRETIMRESITSKGEINNQDAMNYFEGSPYLGVVTVNKNVLVERYFFTEIYLPILRFLKYGIWNGRSQMGVLVPFQNQARASSFIILLLYLSYDCYMCVPLWRRTCLVVYVSFSTLILSCYDVNPIQIE